ncbi:MAG: response regulator [bacterium]
MSEENLKPRVLFFVEDEPEIVTLYTTAFEESGFLVDSVSNGRDAIERLEYFVEEDVKRPNVMILDILLPDASGMDILSEVRRRPLFNNTPVIMFTNFSSDELREQIRQIPNTEYVLKMEITPDEFVAKVKRMVGIE